MTIRVALLTIRIYNILYLYLFYLLLFFKLSYLWMFSFFSCCKTFTHLLIKSKLENDMLDDRQTNIRTNHNIRDVLPTHY